MSDCIAEDSQKWKGQCGMSDTAEFTEYEQRKRSEERKKGGRDL